MGCSEGCKKGCVFGCGGVLAVVALVLGLVWSTIYLSIMKKQLVLKTGSTNYEMWKETPIPMYLELYLFNWTNSEHMYNHSVKPHFVQLGPYVFNEHHKRTNIQWNENHTITFEQIRTWGFEPALSNGSLDDEITNLNVITSTVAYAVRNKHYLIQKAVDYLMREKDEQVVITKTARELLFDGYDDPLIDLIRLMNNTGFDIPYDKFGWFYGRDGSAEYDGTFTMFTGVNDLSKLGVIDMWNGVNKTIFYPHKCGEVRGTTGELWPPIKGKDSVTVYATDLCRPVTLSYSKPYSKLKINGNLYVGDESVFDNGELHPEAACYCLGEPSQCPDLKSGMLNVSSCRFGAPAFVSYPHFYLADASYIDAVDGLSPNQEDHEFRMALEPSTGIPLTVRAQFQINILLAPLPGIEMFKDAPKIFIPMLWFRQTAELTEEFASQARLGILMADLGIYIAYGLGALGIVILIIGIVFFCTGRWKRDDDDQLLAS